MDAEDAAAIGCLGLLLLIVALCLLGFGVTIFNLIFG